MVMESDLRPQRSSSHNYRSSNSKSQVAPLSEFFICFTSKLPSPAVAAPAAFSMKLPPAKSVLSPGRTRESHSASSSSSHISLSTSLSRRLRTNASLKGGQASPMFPPGGRPSGSGGKRKGSAFESPEPSSPKVTCIGQVRVKGKRHGRKKISKEGSVRDSSFGGKPSLCSGEEQCCVNRNVKWVTICEGLRCLGADFNCLFPCRKNDGIEREGNSSGGGFCGAVFARWVVEEEDSRGKKIELVVGDEEDDGGADTQEIEGRSYRRNRLEHIEFSEIQNFGGDGGRVSICIPPKNALLLMRCRSDPVKMAALANKCYEAPTSPLEDEGEENVFSQEEEAAAETSRTEEEEGEQSRDKSKLQEEDQNSGEHDEQETEITCFVETNQVDNVEDFSAETLKEVADEALLEDEEDELKHTLEETDQSHVDPFEEKEAIEEKKLCFEDEQEVMDLKEVPEVRNDTNLVRKSSDKPVLPDCLLLMMCEPKLSMEVSKETWVCTTDFIRWVPGGGRPKKSAGGDDIEKKKRSALTSAPGGVVAGEGNKGGENSNFRIKRTNEEKVVKIQPPRSSCHYPSQQSSKGESIAMAIEKKLISAKGFEPFVLTRCKSEPVRTAGSKLVQQDI